MVDQFMALPRKYPETVMKTISTNAVMDADPPTRTSFFEAEFKSQTEKQEDHTDLGEHFNVFAVRDRWKKFKMRTNQEACNDITKNQRLFDLAEDDRRHRSCNQDQAQILNQIR